MRIPAGFATSCGSVTGRLPSYDLGYYYITSNNNLVGGHIKLDELGRELRVLKAYEEVADGKLK
jgi:hypothetical protein